jgi:hypothetical protein
MTPIDRAERAKALLQDELLKQAFSDIKKRLVDQLEATAIHDIETQHEIALMLQLLKRVRTQLETYVGEGAIEAHKTRQENFLERMRQKLA